MTRKTKKYVDTDYNIGLDIGVASVGWAVTKNYELLKNGKQRHLWGFNIFSQAKTASERRAFRNARRRLSRRKIRIKLLQDLTSEMISPVDEMFFKKLENSYLVKEDRLKKNIHDNSNILFSDGLTDKEYYKKYPTIYHLRKAIVESNEKFDPRLIYLAMHHIVKYRGNFLYEEQNIGGNSGEGLESNIKNVFEYYAENGISFESVEVNKVVSTIANDESNGKDKIKKIINEVNDEQKSILKEITNAILGYKFDPKILFFIEDEDTVSFLDDDFQERYDSIVAKNDDATKAMEFLQKAYNNYLLKKILGDVSEDSKCKISDSMINKYNNHANDLKLLKKLSKNNKEIKNLLKKDGAYEAYIKQHKGDNKKTTKELLYSEIKKAINKENSSIEAEILKKIELDTFLPRINSTDNGAIPYQYHKDELEKIISNQEKYYDCLKKNKEKILSLVSFKIPYYVGPYDENNKENNAKVINNNFAWIKRKDDGKNPIRPWNFYESVDIDETAKRFINRMRNHCSYLLEENTLPKNSLLLERFNLYNELNKIRLNNKTFDKKTKGRIINELFLKKNNISKKDLSKWLINNQYVLPNTEFDLTGFQGDDKFASNLKTERKFRELFGKDFDNKKEDIEKIIEYLTIYKEKEIIERRLKQEKLCNENLIQSILKINCSGYGRLSRKLLNELVSQNIADSRSQGTIMSILEETNKNFIQILNDKGYGFIEQINEINQLTDYDQISYDHVEKIPCSPALKRGIWQSVRAVQDIVKYMGHEPKNIYIEFARNEGEKKRTDSRYSKLEKIYSKHFESTKEYNELLEYENKKGDLNDTALYLYFLQNGKCLYSGETLYINQLSTYQIDHILPRCYVKDDSIDNLALVKSKENQRKSDNLLLSESIISRQKPNWKRLLEARLISQEKYYRLIKTDISEIEISNFVSRSLTETRQICVHVRNLLNSIYSNSNISVIHAGISSEYRKQNELFKIRDINNFHHAHDAYLTCMFGEYIDRKLPQFSQQNVIKYSQIKKAIEKRKKEEKTQNNRRSNQSFIIFSFNNDKDDIDDITGEVWDNQRHADYVKKIFKYSDYYYNYQSRKYEGKLFKANPLKATDKKAKVGIKENMPVEKYGGYQELQTSFVVCCTYEANGKTKKSLITIPVIHKNRYEEFVKNSIKGEIKSIRCLNIGQTFIEDGSLYSIVGAKEIKSLQPIIITNQKELKLLSFITSEMIRQIIDNKKLKEEEKIEKLEEMFKRIDEDYDRIVGELIKDLMSKIGGNIPRFESDIKKINTNISDLNIFTKSKLVLSIVKPIIGGSRDNIVIEENGVNVSNYGRIQSSLDLNKAELLFTSPSGLFSFKTRL